MYVGHCFGQWHKRRGTFVGDVNPLRPLELSPNNKIAAKPEQRTQSLTM